MDSEHMINIDDIIRKIREDIKDNKITCDIPDFQEIIVKKKEKLIIEQADINSENEYLKQNYYLSKYREINCTSSGFRGLKVFIKRIVRKMIQFYIEPIVQEQSTYNSHLSHAFDEMAKLIQIQEKQIEFLQSEIDTIKYFSKNEEK